MVIKELDYITGGLDKKSSKYFKIYISFLFLSLIYAHHAPSVALSFFLTFHRSTFVFGMHNPRCKNSPYDY